VTERSLIPHHAGAAKAGTVVARVELEPGAALRFEYRLTGPLGQLAIPRRAAPRRAERLWEHTCFEAFVAPGAGAAYYELNFSPSTEWAAYAFDDYREGMQALPLAGPPSIVVTETAEELRVTAALEPGALRDAPWPWRIGLTAVVEDRAGQRAYFALRHPRENPDFHDVAGFTVLLDGSAR
jgi:hypothetical protein